MWNEWNDPRNPYRLEKERDEARSIARRLLRERDEANSDNAALWRMYAEWKAENATLQSQVNHLESDRDALARQCDELREALEQVEWERVHLPYKDEVLLMCPWCGGCERHEPDCPRQRALGKA